MSTMALHPRVSPYKWRNREQKVRKLIKCKEYDRLYHRAESLSRVFFLRRSLRLRLCNNYLVKLWRCSSATVQRTLKKFEDLGLLKRFTEKPKRVGGKGKQAIYTQKRLLCLLVPKPPSLVDRNDSQSNSSVSEEDTSLNHETWEKELSFEDYLANRKDVPKGAWLHFLRSHGVLEHTIGGCIRLWQDHLQKRPDLVESAIHCAKEAKLEGQQKLGFVLKYLREQCTHEPQQPRLYQGKAYLEIKDKVGQDVMGYFKNYLFTKDTILLLCPHEHEFLRSTWMKQVKWEMLPKQFSPLEFHQAKMAYR